MKAADFPGEGGPIARLDAAKATLARFIEARGDDLVGIVRFANYPDLVAAPTLDRRFLVDALRAIRPAGIVDDGTSLGDALVVALGAARRAPSRRKVVILLTDGRNAPAVPRPVDPLVAAEIARGLGVRLYTVAIGRPAAPLAARRARRGRPALARPRPRRRARPRPAPAGWPSSAAAGRSRRPTPRRSAGSSSEIDALERSPVAGTVRTIYRERFAPWVAVALGFLAVDLGLARARSAGSLDPSKDRPG